MSGNLQLEKSDYRNKKSLSDGYFDSGLVIVDVPSSFNTRRLQSSKRDERNTKGWSSPLNYVGSLRCHCHLTGNNRRHKDGRDEQRLKGNGNQFSDDTEMNSVLLSFGFFSIAEITRFPIERSLLDSSGLVIVKHQKLPTDPVEFTFE